ncbi:hypothetical protein DFH08DRAFT_1044054 [Mycena albidolilacea]|uniref:Uncharacterized protein n=1 Tax=Mycena albidolilacea TaxID=1033008 RepID=A0AAD6ZA30_9AGAR|nr:hypothetical protein DFH08DRAFT_1044054 [Mycena albidolilacea]
MRSPGPVVLPPLLLAFTRPSSAPAPAARLSRSPARPWFLVRPHHTGLPRGAPAFAVLGSAAHLRVLHPATPAPLHVFTRLSSAPAPAARLSRSPARPWFLCCAPPRPAPHPILLSACRMCTMRSFVLEHRSLLPGSPTGPQFARLTTANHSAIRSAPHALARRTSRSILHPAYSNSRTAPACIAHSASALPHFELVHMLPALRARRLLVRTFRPTHLFPRRHSASHCACMSRTRHPPAPRWPTLTPRPVRASIPLAFAPRSTCNVHLPAAAAAAARTSRVRTFVHAQRAHTPLAPRPRACDRMRAECRHCLARVPSTLSHLGTPRCDDVMIYKHWMLSSHSLPGDDSAAALHSTY